MTKYKDTIVGVASICIAVALFAATFGIKEFSRTRLGADFVPRVTAVILFALGAGLIIRDLRANRGASAGGGENAAVPKTKTGFGGVPAVLVNIALFVGYLLFLDKVGFVIMTPVYMFIQILLLTNPKKYRLGWYAFISVVVGVGAYLLFTRAFQVMLPPGWVEL